MTDSNREEQVNQVIAAFLEAERQGQAPSRDEVLRQHADLADELRSFFNDRAGFQHLAAPITALPATLDQDNTPDGVLATVRYFGDYELLQEIARGGMGVVFKARQVSLNRIVALKMMLKGELASAADVQRFHSEAQAAANLDHPHIVPIFEVGEHAGQQYFSMKFVEAGSLTKKVPELVNDPKSAARLLATVARAVHYAHQRGILHRDLKPANILLDVQGQPHVSDFGLAKRVEGGSDVTRTGAIVGTPSYMAPEQASGKKGLSTAADVYSLGAILYELLTGKPPFRGESPLDTLLQVSEREPQSPRSLNPRADPDLETVCLKCLDKTPAQRYGSAEALADDLERWRAGEPIQARRAGSWERVVKWTKRRPAMTAALGAILGVALVGFVAVLWQWRTAVAERDAKDRALRVSEGLRLTVHSEVVRPTNPGLALLLAIEGGERHRGALAHNAIQAALDACREERTLLGHEKEVRGGIYSPDGRYVVTWSSDGARVWEAATGREARFLGKANVVSASYSLDGERLATLAAGFYTQVDSTGLHHQFEETTVRVHNSASGRVLAEWKDTAKVEGQISRWHDGYAASFSPDGRRLAVATGQWDCPVRVHDSETGAEICMLLGHTAPVFAVAYSSNGRTIATASLDKTVRLWDPETGRPLHTLTDFRCAVRRVAFSPDGERVLAVGEGNLHHFEMTSRGIHHSMGSHVGAATEDSTVMVWDAATGKRILRLATKGIGSASFSPDGRRLLTDGQRTELWDAATGKRLLEFPRIGGGSDGVAAAFSPDGRFIAAGDFLRVRLFETEQGKEILTLQGHTGDVRSIAFNPDGRRLLTAASDGTARLWVVGTDEQTMWSRGYWPEIHFLGMSPDGRRLVTSGINLPVQVWETQTWQMISSYEGQLSKWDYVEVIAFSGDGRRVASSAIEGKAVHVWEVDTGKPVGVIPSPDRHRVTSVGLDRDGKRLLTAQGNVATLWDVASGQQLLLLGAKDAPIESALLSPDNQWILTENYSELTGGQGSLSIGHLHDASTGKLVHRLATEESGGEFCTSACFSADGQFLLTAYGKEAQLWETKTGQLRMIFRGHQASVQFAAFSPDKKRVVTAANDRTARLWETGTGRELLILKGHPKEVTYAAFSPDGSKVITTGDDFQVRLWDAVGGIELAAWPHISRFRRVHFSADNQWVFTLTREGARRWPVDILSFAKTRKPRDLTPDERRRFEVNRNP